LDLLSQCGQVTAEAVAVVDLAEVASVAATAVAVSVGVTSAEAGSEAAVLVVAVLAVLQLAVFVHRLVSTIAAPISPDAAQAA
jgi:hypothetical protein